MCELQIPPENHAAAVRVGALLAAGFGSEWVVMGARPRKLESDLPKRQKPKVNDCLRDRKSTRLNSSHITRSRMPSSA